MGEMDRRRPKVQILECRDQIHEHMCNTGRPDRRTPMELGGGRIMSPVFIHLGFWGQSQRSHTCQAHATHDKHIPSHWGTASFPHRSSLIPPTYHFPYCYTLLLNVVSTAFCSRVPAGRTIQNIFNPSVLHDTEAQKPSAYAVLPILMQCSTLLCTAPHP